MLKVEVMSIVMFKINFAYGPFLIDFTIEINDPINQVIYGAPYFQPKEHMASISMEYISGTYSNTISNKTFDIRSGSRNTVQSVQWVNFIYQHA